MVLMATALVALLSVGFGVYFSKRATAASPNGTSTVDFTQGVSKLPGRHAPTSGVFTASGGLFLAFPGRLDKYSSSGAVQWSMTLPQMASIQFLSAVDEDTVIAAGSVIGDFGSHTSHGGSDALVARIRNGAITWSTLIGTAYQDGVVGLLVSTTGVSVLASLSTAPTSVDPQGTPFASITQFDLAGSQKWSQTIGDQTNALWAAGVLEASTPGGIDVIQAPRGQSLSRRTTHRGQSVQTSHWHRMPPTPGCVYP
jgi:hypothetical protein